MITDLVMILNLQSSRKGCVYDFIKRALTPSFLVLVILTNTIFSILFQNLNLKTNFFFLFSKLNDYIIQLKFFFYFYFTNF